jgi:hypothetical protein
MKTLKRQSCLFTKNFLTMGPGCISEWWSLCSRSSWFLCGSKYVSRFITTYRVSTIIRTKVLCQTSFHYRSKRPGTVNLKERFIKKLYRGFSPWSIGLLHLGWWHGLHHNRKHRVYQCCLPH